MEQGQTIGEKILRMRNVNNISQAQLAEKVFTSQQMINAIEHNASKPSVDLALRIADVFGITLDELCRK